MLRGLKNFPRKDRPDHYRINLMEESGMEKEVIEIPSRGRFVFNQTNINTVLRAVQWKLLRDRAELVWPSREIRCHLEWKPSEPRETSVMATRGDNNQ